MRFWHCERLQCGLPSGEKRTRLRRARLSPDTRANYYFLHEICYFDTSPFVFAHAGLHQSDVGVRGLKPEREAAVRCKLANRRAKRGGTHPMRYILGGASTTSTLRAEVGLSAPIWVERKASRIGGKRVAQRL
jgi:hypothetical protein